MKTALRVVLIGLLSATTALAGDVRVLIVTGLGGEPLFEKRFDGWSKSFREVALARFGAKPEHVVWLAPSGADGRSDRDTVLQAITSLGSAMPDDSVLLIALIGHGTARDDAVAFNLPGPDLSASALDSALDGISSGTVVVANLASASGPFIPIVSAPRRVVITATANAAEFHVARFGGFFVEAFASEAADADKDERVSILEAFEFARRAVEKSFADDRLLQTEHALLDDSGDGEGTMEPARSDVDGVMARALFLDTLAGGASSQRGLALTIAARRVVADIEALKMRKRIMRRDDYEQELETLLVALAMNRRAASETGQ